MIRHPLWTTLAFLAIAATAHAEGGAVHKDPERFGPGGTPGGAAVPGLSYAEPDAVRPPRRTVGSPGYVGSDYGLGKPAFTGLGARSDWGRSSD